MSVTQPAASAAGLPAAPTYTTTCPACGSQLAPFVGDPQSAPWLCGPPQGCSHAWFPSQLSAAARQAIRPNYRDFGFGPAAAGVLQAVEADIEAAAARGTSALPEQLLLLGLSTLQQLSSQRQISAAFQALVKLAVQAKGGNP